MRNLFFSTWLYLCLALAFVTLVGFEAFVFKTALSTNGDYFEHLAALNEWLKRPFFPDNPQLVSPASSARYTPFYFPFVLIGSALGWDHWITYDVISLITACIFMATIFAFARALHPNPVTPVLALLVFMIVWYQPWNYSSVYEVSTVFRTGAFPSTISFAISLGILAMLTTALKAKRPGHFRLTGIALGTALVLATHLLTGAFLLGTAGIFILLTKDATHRGKAMTALAVMAGTGLATLWPFYNVWAVAFSSWSGSDIPWVFDLKTNNARAVHYLGGGHRFYESFRLIPVLIGLVCAIWLACRYRNFVPLAGILVFASVYATNTLIAIPLGHRFIIYAIFFSHVAIILVALDLWQQFIQTTTKPGQTVPHPVWNPKPALVTFTVITAALALSVSRIVPHARITHSVGHKNSIAIQALTDETSIIAGHIPLIWRLPVYDRKILKLRHPNPLVPDRTERSIANHIVHSLAAPELEAVIIACFGVTHVLTSGKLPNLFFTNKNDRQVRAITQIRKRNLSWNQVGKYILVELDTPPETLTCPHDLTSYLRTALMEIRARHDEHPKESPIAS